MRRREEGGHEPLTPMTPMTPLEKALAELAASPPGPWDSGGTGPGAFDGTGDFALRILHRVGIPPDRYDTYTRVELAIGGLYVAWSPDAVTGAALEEQVGAPPEFEELHRSRTGRSAVPATDPPSGLRTFLRTGRAGHLRIDLEGLPAAQRAALDAVRAVPYGQLRPVAWVAREAEVADRETVLAALAANPVPVLVPSHRVTHDDATPCDIGYPAGVGPALRAAEGVDDTRLERLIRQGLLLLGSDTTHVYCHPTCAHARRITPAHQVPFHSAREAQAAGYRACRSCRPVAV